MRRLLPLLLVTAATLATTVAVGGEDAPVREGPRVLDPRDLGVGRLLPDVAYTDVDGNERRLSDHHGRTLVVLSRSVTCPLCKRYGPTLKGLVEEWSCASRRRLPTCRRIRP